MAHQLMPILCFYFVAVCRWLPWKQKLMDWWKHMRKSQNRDGEEELFMLKFFQTADVTDG